MENKDDIRGIWGHFCRCFPGESFCCAVVRPLRCRRAWTVPARRTWSGVTEPSVPQVQPAGGWFCRPSTGPVPCEQVLFGVCSLPCVRLLS